jgi:hypothetical protein
VIESFYLKVSPSFYFISSTFFLISFYEANETLLSMLLLDSLFISAFNPTIRTYDASMF